MFVKAEDPDLPAFYFDPVLNPIAHYRQKSEAVEEVHTRASCLTLVASLLLPLPSPLPSPLP
jgi:hypothetical protein